MNPVRPPRTEKLSRIRKVIATRMRDSLATTAQLTTVVEVDLSKTMQLRQSHGAPFREAHGVSLGPLAIVARGVCRMLAQYPVLNARIDLEEGTVTYLPAVNLGIAVDSETGLLVPNLKNADGLTVAALATGIKVLAERARSRRLTLEDLEGGTFTITNPGGYGTFLGTPVISQPQAGILGTYAIVKRPWVITDDNGADAIAIRSMMNLTLTYDHRLVDGALAGRFLRDLRERLQTWGESDY